MKPNGCAMQWPASHDMDWSIPSCTVFTDLHLFSFSVGCQAARPPLAAGAGGTSEDVIMPQQASHAILIKVDTSLLGALQP